MEEKAIELIENLANQLGVAVPYLWEVLVKQAWAVLFSEVLFLVVMLFMGCFSYITLNKFVIKRPAKLDRYGNMTDIEIWIRGGVITGVAVVSLVFVIQLIICIHIIPKLLINPEYWALQQIMNMM